ncbi:MULTISPECIES: hypothetical protein [unclassified Streptomyces]|uniref:Uncharacterized protein n=1 Tax=Streptomyces sp. NBC_00119 TaxID=2975659 RepID=A0AAU1ULG9_9ACTN|nr:MULTISPECIES: hypothetical protein [unclassified Streptomyces]MCX4649567.1 hypothetical protein [Streptomyces sp. NBC_01446]MCX5321227.1 hypothetical protein [Streptomyces sp. NBC_00120]
MLSDIKSHPGNVSLNSLLDEISQLKQVRAIGVPEKVFAGIGVQVINAWRARSSASSPSHPYRIEPHGSGTRFTYDHAGMGGFLMAKILGTVRTKMLTQGLPAVLNDLDVNGNLRPGSTLRPKRI